MALKEFWKHDKPLITMNLLDSLSNEFEFAPQFHRMINLLLETQLIIVFGVVISGRKNAREFKRLGFRKNLLQIRYPKI